MANYLEFESMSAGMENKVKQDLKFKTGNFVWNSVPEIFVLL